MHAILGQGVGNLRRGKALQSGHLHLPHKLPHHQQAHRQQPQPDPQPGAAAVATDRRRHPGTFCHRQGQAAFLGVVFQLLPVTEGAAGTQPLRLLPDIPQPQAALGAEVQKTLRVRPAHRKMHRSPAVPDHRPQQHRFRPPFAPL